MIWRLAWWSAAAWAVGGLVAGVSRGAAWLELRNDAGYAAGWMLIPPLCLVVAAAVLRLSSIGSDEVGAFYSRLSWSLILGGAVWSRVGWLGCWPESLVLSVVEWVLLSALVPSGLLALAAAARVARRSAASRIRWALGAFVGACVTVSVFCLLDSVRSVEDAGPWLYAFGCAALLAVPVAAVAVAYTLPDRRPP